MVNILEKYWTLCAYLKIIDRNDLWFYISHYPSDEYMTSCLDDQTRGFFVLSSMIDITIYTSDYISLDSSDEFCAKEIRLWEISLDDSIFSEDTCIGIQTLEILRTIVYKRTNRATHIWRIYYLIHELLSIVDMPSFAEDAFVRYLQLPLYLDGQVFAAHLQSCIMLYPYFMIRKYNRSI